MKLFPNAILWAGLRADFRIILIGKTRFALFLDEVIDIVIIIVNEDLMGT